MVTNGNDYTDNKDADNKDKDTQGSNEKTLLINPILKEITEFLSKVGPVLGTVYVILIVLVQDKYCKDAENFYNIDGSHFGVDNIQRFLLPALLSAIYLLFLFISKLYLIKKYKIYKAYRANCVINMVAALIFMIGIWISFSGVIKIILFCVGIIIFIIELFCLVKGCNTNKSNNKNEDCEDIRVFFSFIFIIFGAWFIMSYMLNPYYFFKKRKYEIIYDENTDFDSNKLDVEVVILHKGSQIITKKGKIVDDTLYIDKCSYEIKEFSQYKYILRGFTEVDNNHNLQKKILLSKGIDNRRRNISLQRECKISRSQFRCWIYGGIYFEN